MKRICSFDTAAAPHIFPLACKVWLNKTTYMHDSRNYFLPTSSSFQTKTKHTTSLMKCLVTVQTTSSVVNFHLVQIITFFFTGKLLPQYFKVAKIKLYVVMWSDLYHRLWKFKLLKFTLKCFGIFKKLCQWKIPAIPYPCQK